MGELRVEEIGVGFGAFVHDVELRALDDRTARMLVDAWIEHALLVVPGQHLTRHEQDEVARRFGDLEFTASPITNLGRDGRVKSDPDDDQVKSIRGNEGWHHDSTYLPVQARGAVFSAEIVPSEGAATGWADMRAAYEALDDATRRRLDGLTAAHSLEYSQGRSGYLPSKTRDDGSYAMYGYRSGEAPRRPLVKVHPDTGRPNLLIGRHAHAVSGMSADDSETFLDELNERAVEIGSTYHHRWEVGDVVIWDNRRLMHRATPFDLTEPRRMWHTRLAGDPTTETAVNYQNDAGRV